MFKFLLISCLLFIARFQIVPESVQVTNLPNMTQEIYQGWLQTDKQTQSYLYYQLISADGTSFSPLDSSTSQIPLILFLEGGPGDSSVLTAWTDFGPYGVNSNLNLTGVNNDQDIQFTVFKRDLTWSGPYHNLLIDSPIFSGYSFALSGGPLNDTTVVGQNLVAFLGRFYQIYPQLLTNPLYIVGHSYGGHWAPYFTYSLVYNHNLTLLDNQINLAGLILLTPLTSARLQKGSAEYYFTGGVTDVPNRDMLMGYEAQIAQDIKANQLVNASLTLDQEQEEILNMVLGNPVSSNMSRFNIRQNRIPSEPYSAQILDHFLSPQTYFNLSVPGIESGRDLLNIPSNVSFLEGYCTNNFMESNDLVLDLAYTVEYLLEQGFNVTILAGQDDSTIPAPGIVSFASALQWSGATGFRSATRKPWTSDGGQVLGTFKRYENLNMVILYNAGHLVSFDQPEATYQFMNMTILNEWQ